MNVLLLPAGCTNRVETSQKSQTFVRIKHTLILSLQEKLWQPFTLVLIFRTIILCRRARENGGAFRRLITSEKRISTFYCVFMDI